MHLQIGRSRCENCGELVDATDDLFVVKPWKGLDAIPGCRPGFYHYECFLNSAFARAYLDLNANQQEQLLDRNEEHAVVLHRTEEFALLHRPLAEQYTFYFLRQGRTVGQLERQRVIEFLQAVAEGQKTDAVDVVPRGNTINLLFPESAPVSIELARADYEQLVDELPKLDEKSDEVIDLGALLIERGVSPLSSDCKLSRAKGRIASVEPLAASGSSYIDLEVEKQTDVRMSAAEFERLRVFASASLAKLTNDA